MALLLQPNLVKADELVRLALMRRFGEGADFETRSEAPGIPLAELVEDDGSSYSPFTDARHFGKVSRLLMRLVYELNVQSDHAARPVDLGPKSVWVADVVEPVDLEGRAQYLAISAGGPAVLVPLPKLSDALLHGEGTVADTRAAARAFATVMSELVNLALPAARCLAAGQRA